MRRFLSVILLITTLFWLPTHVAASSIEREENSVLQFDDGSYIYIEINVHDTRAMSSKNGSKTYTYVDLLGNEKWKATLYGSFTYNGSTSNCTTSSVSITIYDSSWYKVSSTSSKMDSTAYGELTMGYRLLGITTDKKTINMSLSCDAHGNLS